MNQNQIPAAAARYPYKAEDGTTRWACCDSAIGPTCEHLAPPVEDDDVDQPVTITLTLTEEEHLSLSAILFRAHMAYASDAHMFEQRVGTADDEPNHGLAAKNARWASGQSQAATAFAERISAKFRTAAGEALGSLPAPIGRTHVPQD